MARPARSTSVTGGAPERRAPKRPGTATFVRAVLTQQVKDSDHGISLSARVDVAAMGADEKEGVTKSMRAINELIKATLQT